MLTFIQLVLDRAYHVLKFESKHCHNWDLESLEKYFGSDISGRIVREGIVVHRKVKTISLGDTIDKYSRNGKLDDLMYLVDFGVGKMDFPSQWVWSSANVEAFLLSYSLFVEFFFFQSYCT